jgi:hypothetical protein
VIVNPNLLAGAQARVSISGAGVWMRLADRPDIDPLPALSALLDLPSQLVQRERYGPGPVVGHLLRTCRALHEALQFAEPRHPLTCMSWAHQQTLVIFAANRSLLRGRLEAAPGGWEPSQRATS